MRPLALRLVVAWVAVAGLSALVGLVVLWPTGPAPDLGASAGRYVDATVESVRVAQCDAIEVEGALSGCRIIRVRLTSGAAEGRSASITVLETQFEVPELRVGDGVVLLDSPSAPEEFRYTYFDQVRAFPMLVVVAAFVVVVAVVGRGRGLRALVGLAASAAVLVAFVVPALLRGSSALPVAWTGAVVVGFVALYLAHGVRRATTVALAGTLASLAIISLLSVAVGGAASLSGLAGDAAQAIRVTADAVDLRGLLVAGFVVGALGVLDDVTVTQVSAVQALLRARPDIERRDLVREAMEVGRDHVASTVNTLVLAYAGASLPLLLFFAQGTTPVSRLLTREDVAVEILRMLVGSIGLVLSVPITTWLAAAVLSPEDASAHSHGEALPDRPPSWDDFAPEA